MSDGKTCPICKLPSGKMGGKHYSCATGRPRRELTAVVPPVVIRRMPVEELGADFLRHRRSPSSRLAWETLWQILLGETEPQTQSRQSQTPARSCA